MNSSCVRNGVHYVDLTGEPFWTKQIIQEYVFSLSPTINRFSFEVPILFFARLDYFATKTGAIIVPSCGFDSVPSDAAAYLANKTLKAIGPSTNGEYLDVDTSISAFSFRGGVSGGTVNSFMTTIESVPLHVQEDGSRPYATSPFIGGPAFPSFQFFHSLPISGMKPLVGGFFIMGLGNTTVVQRSYGLRELYAKTGKLYCFCF